MKLSIGASAPRILDFDVEARPLGWYGGDFTHKEITVISSAWADDPGGTLETFTITKRAGSTERMLRAFVKRYNEAGIVSGHYVRGFDLPLINWNLVEYDFEPLGPKLVSDTKGDLLKMHGVSKSQENLGSFLGLANPKVGMNMADWRAANRLDPLGIEYAVERCEGDVLQHIEMRRALMEKGMLGPPKLWDGGGGGGLPRYQP